MKKIKLIYIISSIEKALSFEWFYDHLNKEKFDVTFILLGKPGSAFKYFLMSRDATCCEIEYYTKTDLITAFFKIIWIIINTRPKIIHTHLMEANLIGLTAAWVLGVPKRIYTRHHAMIHHREHKTGFKYDKWCNWICTDIVAPSENVRKILTFLEKVPSSKVHLIHHGFDFDYFRSVAEERITKLKSKYGITKNDYPIIGVIARYTHWKGIQYVIPAFQSLLVKYPKAKLLLANAKGDYKHEITRLLDHIPVESFREIEFEEDLAALYKLFDMYIHTPIDGESEAFGQTYVEALISGVPSVFTLSGVAPEIKGLDRNVDISVVNYKSTDQILSSIESIISKKGIRFNGMSIFKLEIFTIRSSIEKLNALYS